MADEYDRKIMPDFLQTAFAVSLGASYKSFEMMLDPMTSGEKVFAELKVLFVMPKEEGLQAKAEALMGVWMDKGMTLVEVCKTAGEKFTEAK